MDLSVIDYLHLFNPFYYYYSNNRDPKNPKTPYYDRVYLCIEKDNSNTNTNAYMNSQTNSAATNSNKPVNTQKSNTYASGYANTTSTNTSVKVVQAVLLKYKHN